MATFRDRKESQNCPVCLEHFKQPRKLPTCKHIFCETCISDTVSKLKTRDDESGDESGFPCPLCRVVNHCPGNTEELLTWVRTLEMAEQTEVKVENMEVCMPCMKLNNTTQAVKYCIDCRESLCAQCFEETQKFRGFQGHIVVEINGDNGAHGNKNKRDMNEALAEYMKCTHHPDKNVTFICEDHDELCCPNCILTNHRKCSKVTVLQDIQVEDSEKEFSKIEGSLKDLSNFCQSIVEAIKENEAENKASVENVRQTITDMRTKVNQLFDVMEETISQECKATMKKISISNEEVVQELQDIIGKLKFSSDLLREIRDQDSLQNVLVKRLQRRLIEFETKIFEIIRGLKQFGFELKIESLLKDLVEVDVNQTTRLVSVNETGNKLIIPKFGGVILKKLEYDITKIGTFSIKSTGSYPTYCDLAYTPENRLIIVESNYGFAYLTSVEYRASASCKFWTFNTGKEEDGTKNPFGVTALQNGIIIVSQPKRNKLFAVNVDEKLEILAEINAPHKAKAVRALNNGDLAVSWTEPIAFGIVSVNFFKLEEKTYFDHDNAGRVMKSFDYMAVDQATSHVIQPCIVDKAVFCFDFHGNPLFEYRHDDLQQPKGAGIDASGNIYVCDIGNASIHIMSSTGIPVRVHRDGCPERPLGLSFNKDKTTFAVTRGSTIYNDTKKREIHVFQLS